jgi:hypothetical protein
VFLPTPENVPKALQSEWRAVALRWSGAKGKAAAWLRYSRASKWLAPLWRRRALRALQPAFASLDAAEPKLEELMRELEQQFVALSDSLQDQHTTSRALAEESARLLRLVLGQEGSDAAIHQAIALLKRPLEFIVLFQEHINLALDRLRVYDELLSQLRAQEDVFRDVIAPLRYLHLLFKVEAAGLPVELQSLFLSLTLEIEQLNDRIAKICDEQFRCLASSQAAVQKLIVVVAARAEEQHVAAIRKKEEIERTLRELQSDLTGSRNQDVRLTSITESIARHMSDIIVGMQFQDITSQKLQHVRKAFRELRAHHNSLTGGSPALAGETQMSDGATLHVLRQVAQLQLGHLDLVQDELARAERQIHDGLGAVLALTKELDGECLTLQGFKSLSAGENGVVPVLLNLLNDMRELLSQDVGLQDEIDATVHPLGGLASNLTNVMRQLCMQIKLIALNAEIQAARVGDGTGLEVLSKRTSHISDETYRITEEMAGQLDSLVSSLASIVEQCEQMTASTHSEQETLATEGKRVEDGLHSFQNRAVQSQRSVAELSRAVCDKARAFCQAEMFADGARIALDEVRKPLQQLVQVASALSADAGSDAKAITAQLERNYTMESERAVHARVLNGQSPEPKKADNDVTLFASAAALDQPSPAAAPATKVAAGDVELF